MLLYKNTAMLHNGGTHLVCQHAHSLPNDVLKEAAAPNLEGSKRYLHAHRFNQLHAGTLGAEAPHLDERTHLACMHTTQ